MTITEKSHVRLSLPTAITVVGALMTMAASSAMAWYALKEKLNAHAENVNVHLDANFIREHGVPVGKWDLAPRDEATAKALEGLQRQADYAVKKADEVAAQLSNTKPRWRP
jgi:hypothetical protein